MRLPGDQAARNIENAQHDGITCSPATWDALGDWAQRLGVALPQHSLPT